MKTQLDDPKWSLPAARQVMAQQAIGISQLQLENTSLRSVVENLEAERDDLQGQLEKEPKPKPRPRKDNGRDATAAA